MRDLLHSADAFVLPTRGEGWGLPVCEAMSMGLPTLATNCSGLLSYLTTENSYPIPVLPELDSLSFVQPDEKALSRLMRLVIQESVLNDGRVAREKGRRAREMMQYYSPFKAVSLMAERLKVLASQRGWDFSDYE